MAQYLAGPVIDGLSVDCASQATLQRLAIPSSVVVFFVALLCLGSWRETLIVFLVSVYCQAVTLALISLCGDTMSALLVVLAPLVQVLSLAGAVHLVNYYRDAPSGSPGHAAARYALKIGWMPCLLSAGTTAVGMASLMVSYLSPIKAFGAYSTAGVIITTGVVLTLVPAALAAARVPVRSRPPRSSSESSSDGELSTSWRYVVAYLAKVKTPVTTVFLLVMCVAGVGLMRLKTSVRIETLFPPDSRILADYRWLEAHVAAPVPLEVLIAFNDDCLLRPSERLDYVRRLETRLQHNDLVQSTMSPLTFLPPLPVAPAGDPQQIALVNRVVDRALLAATPMLVERRLLADDGKVQQWRLRGFVSSLVDCDYARLLNRVHQELSGELVDAQGKPLGGVALHATGTMPLVHEIQRRLMLDLRNSFLTAFLVITVVMTIVQGSVRAGLVAMIPNVFPTLLLFGAFGWWRLPVDIGSVMTASVALGVAVDDTLHFLAYFQRGLERGKRRREAVQDAYRHCGVAMLQTSVISAPWACPCLPSAAFCRRRGLPG